MEFILNDRVYDTENALEIFEFDELVPVNALGRVINTEVKKRIYRTDKGNWFSVAEYRYEYRAKIETEQDIRNILKKKHQVELYEKYFGELERG